MACSFLGQNNTGVLPETAFAAVNAIGAVVDVTEMDFFFL